MSASRPIEELRRDAVQIWRAGVDAVQPQRLVPAWLRVEGRTLVVGQVANAASCQSLPLDSIGRIAVVGGGKAGQGMARAVEAVLGPDLMAEKRLVGWVNVPAGDLGQPPTQRIHLHPARPVGVNEPTAEGVAGAEEMLRLVASLGPDDLCLCLLSGGGSALMPAPVEGIALADKVAVTRHLSAAGANIEQLNTVRKQLSRIKGGGLLRACRAGRLVSLVISDVLGDRLDLIASGPTVIDTSTPQDALDVLRQFHAREAGVSAAVSDYLQRKAQRSAANARSAETSGPPR
ncbi:MAG: glycerate-2-kinase family protein [Thermoguttaceae bacterium]